MEFKTVEERLAYQNSLPLEERIAFINSLPPEEPTAEDLAAIAAAEAEDPSEAVPFDEFMKELEDYSGRLLLRLPRSLHKRLKREAAAEGVSLNQYMLYKLAQ